MPNTHPDVVVVGGGVFGVSTAYFLRRQGLAVLLLDAWGVANPRATSGGESRIIRAGYGEQSLYTRWAWEALRDWKTWQDEWGVRIFHPTGVLWLADEEAPYVAESLRHLTEWKIPVERLDAGEMTKRFPAFAALNTRVALFEPEAGALLARQACLAIEAAFVREGGTSEVAAVLPPRAPLESLETTDGRKISAGSFVFACGPWLKTLFPELLGERIQVTKQEVFFFGAPSGLDFSPPQFPAWIDISRASDLKSISYYGFPVLDGRGVKIACDVSGPPFDPTTGDRVVSAEGLAGARAYMSARFPKLAGAPLCETRVCQYERTRGSNLILDRHPEMNNVWIAGGGSGHGFKLGPAVGRFMTGLVTGAPLVSIPQELRI